VLFKLLFGKTALLRQALTTLGQFGQADHLGLIGFQKTEVGTVHPVQARAAAGWAPPLGFAQRRLRRRTVAIAGTGCQAGR